MEREEPKFDGDMSGVEFRPRVDRAPSRSSHSSRADAFAWKIGAAVGIGVLAALLIFNAYERHQARQDAEAALQILKQETAKLDREMQAVVRSTAVRGPSPRQAAAVHPMPPGYRCVNGVLLYREGGSSWIQITARSRQMYCPYGSSSVDECYMVTPRSVGCGR